MIFRDAVRRIDIILDAKVGQEYKDQPLAQDWARVAKMQEEIGEAIAELILFTGQNPRKQDQQNAEAFKRFLGELADAALTGIYAIQHFTKDIELTEHVIKTAQKKHLTRLEAL